MKNVGCRFVDQCEISEVVDELIGIINPAFVVGEYDMWKGEVERTTAEELKFMIKANEIIIAFKGNEIIGTGRVVIHNSIGDLGMLACKLEYRGKGAGRLMLQFFEDYCTNKGCSHAQVEVLYPSDGLHIGKNRLIKWYEKSGYQREQEENFSSLYPHLANKLAVCCTFAIYRKALRA